MVALGDPWGVLDAQNTMEEQKCIEPVAHPFPAPSPPRSSWPSPEAARPHHEEEPS